MAEEKKLVVRLKDEVQRVRARWSDANQALKETGSPLNIGVSDFAGGVAGWLAAVGVEMGVRKLADEKTSEPTWKTSLAKAGVGLGAYGLNLAVPYDLPRGGIRQGIGTGALVCFFNGADGIARKLYSTVQQRSAEKQIEAQRAAQQALAAQQAAQQAAKK